MSFNIGFKKPTAKRNLNRSSCSPHEKQFPLQCQPATKKYLVGAQTHVGYLENGDVKIRNKKSIQDIYFMGCFGKGKFSRSDPVILDQLDGSIIVKENKDNTNELEADSNVPAEISEQNVVSSDTELSSTPTNDMCDEDIPSDSSNCKISNNEDELKLMLEEAYFLSYALGCLVVKKNDEALDLIQLWNEFCSLAPSKNFPCMYAAYHYFRSKGWVVQSGAKFGADFLLYKDGPAFYHASYSVIVKMKLNREEDRIETWRELIALNRVTENVGKEVLLCYVIVPRTMTVEDLKSPACIRKFQVQEVISRRWVASEERIQENATS